jgi:hypothetical protein
VTGDEVEFVPAPLVFRVFVDGRLVRRDVVTWDQMEGDDAEVLVERLHLAHLAITSAAEEAGRPWLVEMFDADEPAGQQCVRFGTDAGGGMVEPLPVPAGWRM